MSTKVTEIECVGSVKCLTLMPGRAFVEFDDRSRLWIVIDRSDNSRDIKAYCFADDCTTAFNFDDDVYPAKIQEVKYTKVRQ